MKDDILEGFDVGDKIHITKDQREYEGILMPHHRFSEEDILTIKLDNGYNIGVSVDKNIQIELVEKGEGSPEGKGRKDITIDKGKPKVSIIGTGGTIASYVEYRTGAVHPAQSEEDILYSNPEIAERCNPSLEILFNKLSEDILPEDWTTLAERVVEEAKEGVEGVVIAHGTDTMGYTSAALSFLLDGLDIPVVLVGSQRSSDRPSTDAHDNLLGAIEVAKSNVPGVYVVMHSSISDDQCDVHRGTKVRKMHTSRRDAFKSINTEPVGTVDPISGDVEFKEDGKQVSEDDSELCVNGGMEEDVELIYANPALTEEKIKRASDNKGVVIAGTGLGHVNSDLLPQIEKMISGGTTVVMTSQCLYGTVNNKVYSSGRSLMEAGVISGEDMLPETALVKLMWALKLEEDTEKVMKKNIAGEFTERRVE